MALINEDPCQEEGRPLNWGQGDCKTGRPERAFGAFVIPSPVTVTAVQLNDFEAYVNALLHNADFNQRGQYFQGIRDLTNNDAEATTFDFPDGSQIQQRDRKYRQMLRIDSDCLHRAARSWGQRGAHVLFVDINGKLVGRRALLNGERVLGSIPMSRIFAEDIQQATMAEPAIMGLTLEWADADDVNFNRVEIGRDKIRDGDGNVFDLKTEVEDLVTQDVTLTNTLSGTPASGIFDIAVHSGACEENNLVRVFNASIATAGRWAVTNATGAAITITTLAVGANGDRLRFTLSTADPDYPTSGGIIRIRQTSIADWSTNGMQYFDVQDDFFVTVP